MNDFAHFKIQQVELEKKLFKKNACHCQQEHFTQNIFKKLYKYVIENLLTSPWHSFME